ncbi:serine/threonine-protein kinase [Nannocystis bainbridge]|uniref:Serine/threonine-protein kinase n=1 Tax=Nannocystis bainbridge TaxID=2995303 RepID=A0ABT5E353_9BACT|nr:serine/threonine-protein kinase [Nannocystis bainbridge]MDC0720296.1 serine/threonine-protein kinase [Nannocystis bainbridge]
MRGSTTDSSETTETTADGSFDGPPGSPPGPGERIGPYRLVRYLGAGGMGLVYEAVDDELGDRVALKTLSRIDPWRLFRLKQEFRTLAGIRHDNLVRHEALVVEDGAWFLAMEYVAGTRLTDAVAADPALLRPVLAQLASGVRALHAAGVVHRDLKPANVLVEPGGRVVILDFGLAESALAGEATPTGRAPAGTPGYVAPELARGVAPAPASDWFAVGVIMFVLLTGELPGQRQRPSICAADVPPDLDDLCAALLATDPKDRPDGAAIVARLGATAAVADALAPLFGRDDERAALTAAIAGTVAGAPGFVRVHGASGVGKTRLVREVLGALERAGAALVLRGRCYECESVPYGGFDAAIDALMRALRAGGRWPAADVAAASTVFPVLSALLPGPQALADADDRSAAFAGVRALLAAAGDGRPVVLFVDDLHHAGADTAGLMLDLLLPRADGLALTIVATCRSDREADSACLRELHARAGARGQAIVERPVAVAALAPAACEALLRHHLGARAEGRIADLTRESGGNPFLLEALARDGAAGPAPAIAEWVRRRTHGLPEEAARLLAAIALSGQPLPQGVLLQAAQVKRPGAALGALRALSLVRMQGSRRWDIVEPSHDRIGEGVVDGLAPALRALLHGSIAEALARERWGSPELRARHWHGAGELDLACGAAEEAAAEAEQALAFERAAALLGDAAAWIAGRDLGRSAALQGRQGRVLVRAGRCAAAAETFLASAEHVPEDSRPEVLRQAADAWMAAGYIDRGLDLLRPMLRAEGVWWPRSPLLAVFALLWTYVRLRLRGIEIDGAAAPTEAQLRRVDLCWSVGMGLTNTMPADGMLFAVRAVLAALQAGEPGRVGRGLAVLGAFHRLIGRAEVGARFVARAREIAEARDDPQLLGLTHVCSAADAMITGDWRECVARTARGLDALSAPRAGMTWERVLGACFELTALDQLGRFVEVERRAGEHLRDAEARGDLYGLVVFSQFFAQARIAAGDLAAARHYARDSVRRWTRRSYTLQHFYALRVEVCCDLYDGEPHRADARLRERWPDIVGAGLLRNPISRVDALLLRARCALARGDRRRAACVARRLACESRPDAGLHARWIRARVAPAHANADAELAAAARGFQAAGMTLAAWSIEHRRAGADHARRVKAEQALRELGVSEPDRWQRVFLP